MNLIVFKFFFNNKIYKLKESSIDSNSGSSSEHCFPSNLNLCKALGNQVQHYEINDI